MVKTLAASRLDASFREERASITAGVEAPAIDVIRNSSWLPSTARLGFCFEEAVYWSSRRQPWMLCGMAAVTISACGSPEVLDVGRTRRGSVDDTRDQRSAADTHLPDGRFDGLLKCSLEVFVKRHRDEHLVLRLIPHERLEVGSRKQTSPPASDTLET